MKRALSILSASLTVLSCAAGKPPVTVEIEGLGSSVISVTTAPYGKEDFGPSDVYSQDIVPRKGRFTIDSLPDYPAMILIEPWFHSSKSMPEGADRTWGTICLMIYPRQTVTVNGKMTDNMLTYRVKGSPENDAAAVIDNSVLPLRKELSAVQELMWALYEGEPTPQTREEAAHLKAQEDSLYTLISQAYAPFIRLNTDSDAAAARMQYLIAPDMVELYPLLSQRIRHGTLGMELEPLYYTATVSVNRDRYVPFADDEPIEFTMPTHGGGTFSTHQDMDKYIVLDFWSGGCAPCLQEMPAMAQCHKKYGDRIVFVGVGCFLPQAKWKADIAAHNMEWTQIRDMNEAGLAVRFSIREFPTKIVLGKNRKIIARYEGLDENFWPWLDELMK